MNFARDRRQWIKWLFAARKRYELSILNYMVTSNHIHLLISDDGHRDTIPKSIQLVAGRSGQEYNQRKKRKGAFWEDRYHATAIEGDEHLAQCMVYIDMNMVRAGVVKHPEEWPFCGYYEIQNPRIRYGLIDYEKLLALLRMGDLAELQESCEHRVEEFLRYQDPVRESKWTESITVGSMKFVKATKERLGIKVKGRKVLGGNGTYELRESAASYTSNFDPENDVLRLENTYFWDNIL